MVSKERGIKEGDAVEIGLLDGSDNEITLRGQVTQIATSADGGESYFVSCPFNVGPAHIRVIVPVEDLERLGDSEK